MASGMNLIPVFVTIRMICAVAHAQVEPHRIPTGPYCSIYNDKTEDNFYNCHLNGTTFFGSFTENKNLRLNCLGGYNNSLGLFPKNDKSMQLFQEKKYFTSIIIRNCLPMPTHSYAEFLAANNVNTTVDRHILGFDNKVSLDPHLLTGLDLKSLKIEPNPYTNDKIFFDLDILKPLENLVDVHLSDTILPHLPEWNRLKSVTLWNGELENPLQTWGECTYLQNLTITLGYVENLPEGWLANCSRLYSLQLLSVSKLRRLPRRMLEGAHALHTLTVRDLQLKDLPMDFLIYTKELRFLDLSSNMLAVLPSNGILSSVPLLEELNLSHNYFYSQVIQDFAPLASLRSLSIDSSDFILSDFNENALKWPMLPFLQRLSLNSHQLTHIWPELHESMPSLKMLNLTNNNINTLTYQDLQQIRINGWEVDLHGNNVEAIQFEQSDYEAALKEDQNISDQAILRIDSLQDCNCHWYWFMRLLRERPTYVLLPELQCTERMGQPVDPISYTDVMPNEMLCRLQESDCALGCACFQQAPDNLVFAYCSGVGLTQIPQIRSLFELHIANNHISTLHASDLSDTVNFLDLRYNQLSSLNADTASKMFAVTSRNFLLAGNPIICDCSNRAMIDVLQRHSKQVIDFENLTCVTKQALREVNVDTLCFSEQFTHIASIIGAFAIILVILLALYNQYRREVHVILRRWGWSCCIDGEELDRDKVYDVFISFAFGDSPFILDELVPKLESDPFSLKVCVHYRDWIVGDWIPAQIARSVKESRRTIIVLSQNFLSSVWALLEFRAAHKQALKDGCPRLVVIMLEDVIGDTRIDRELRAYLVTNTYIKRSDPMFWEKLHNALSNRQCSKVKIDENPVTSEKAVALLKETDPPIKLRKDGENVHSPKI